MQEEGPLLKYIVEYSIEGGVRGERSQPKKACKTYMVALMNVDSHTVQSNPQAEAKKLEDAATYLSLPSTKAELEEKGHSATGKGMQSLGSCTISKDSFQISTLVCSTKLTQNGEF